MKTLESADLISRVRITGSGDDRIATNWIALTGAPGAGKSTLLNRLANRGYSVRAEQARLFIEEQLRAGLSTAELSGHSGLLSDKILQLNWHVHQHTSPEDLVVFDRGLPDVVAFTFVDGLDPTQALEKCVRFKFRAAVIFKSMFEHSDPVIYHNKNEIEFIANLCAEIYKALGTYVTWMPDNYNSLDERTNFVERLIRSELIINTP
jgi:predicted ATPase